MHVSAPTPHSETPSFGPGKPLLLGLLAFAFVCFLLAEAFGGTARVTVAGDRGSATADVTADMGGMGFAPLQAADGAILAVVRYWPHEGWSELAIGNASIAASPGPWSGSYEAEVDGVTVTRSQAVFHRGTGFLEVFGEPRLAPTIRGADALRGFFPDTSCGTALAWSKGYAPGYVPSEWPLPVTEWHGANGTVPLADMTPNAHQTGSPRNSGCLPREVAALWIAQGDPAAARRLGGFLWAWAMNQARRPVTFLHPMTGEVYEAAENPGLTMGDYGPSSAFGSTEGFGDPFKSNKSPWTGLEIEHIEADRLATLAALYDSGFAAEQLTAICEGLLTQKFLRPPSTVPVDPGSTRALFWAAKVLTWQVALARDLDHRIAAWQGLSKLATTYLTQSRTLPVPHFRKYSPTFATPPAKPKHVAPSLAELEDYADWYSLEFPAGATDPYAVVQEFEAQRDGEASKINDTWSFDLVWQIAIGGPVSAFVQRTTKAASWKKIQQHVAWTLTYARNPAGTFWQEVCPNYAPRHGDKDDGKGRDGLAFWIAGGLAACAPLADGPGHDRLVADVATVTAGNKYTQVGNSYGVAFEWFLEGAKDPAIAGQIGWVP